MGQEDHQMNCMKCGISIGESQVFCEDCLKVMERYPVKSNVQVTIPVRPAVSTAKKRSRRNRISGQDEQLRILRTKLRLAHTALIIVLLAFFVLAGIMVKYLNDPQTQYSPGQNYSTMPSTDTT
jgi:NMD protein affecting ribosome stability and mRNA decay